MLTCGQLAAAINAGQVYPSSWRKAPTQTTGAGIWVDLSMSPGNPPPNYYAASPLVSVAMRRSTHGGLDHGADPAGAQKLLHEVSIGSTTAGAALGRYQLLDYLLHYPFVEMADTQSLTQGDALPRYTDGAGVRIMPVLVAPQTGGASFFCTYTNSDGVAGRVTPTVTCNTQTVNGTIVSSATATANTSGPFLPLQRGDRGVRQIDEVTFLSADVGLLALVLVRPLCPAIPVYGVTAPHEVDFLRDFGFLPPLEADAYLNWIVAPSATIASAAIIGNLSTAWV